jgi:hypothetical protein
MLSEIETNFTTKAGQTLANALVDHIVRTENPLNWDECAYAIAEELCKRADNGNIFPVGSIIRGEVKNHLENKMKENRIYITINEVN